MVKMSWGVLLILIILKGGHSLTLLQGTTILKLPYDFPVGTTFYRVSAVDEKSGKIPDGLVNYHLLKSVAFPIESKSGRGLFTVDEHTGSVMLSPHRKHSVAEFRGTTFALDVAALPASEPSVDPTHVTIVITITDDNFTRPDCGAREELCFAAPDLYYQVPETVVLGTLLGNLRPVPYSRLCPDAAVKYELLSDDNFMQISENGDLRTNQSFDFEDSVYHEWNVSCTVSSHNENDVFQSRIRLFVLDVDDNAPYVQNSTSTFQELDLSDIVPGKPLPIQLTVLDADSPAVSKIRVHLTDPLKLFFIRDPVFFHGVNGDHMLINTALVSKSNLRFPGPSYNVSVTFNDTSLVGKTEKDDVVFHISINNRTTKAVKSVTPPKELQVTANIFRHSTLHARVIQPLEVSPHEGYSFRLTKDKDTGRIFAVTPLTGVVYVADALALASSTTRTFRLELAWRNRDVTDRRCVVVVRVLDAGNPSNDCGAVSSRKYPSCAVHGTAESCSASCGRGASGGFCQWRSQSSPTLAKEYATCSPHLPTCPDGKCDELEQMDTLLCPQDCAGHVQGEAVLAASGRGVGKAAAPCTCIGPDTCVCMQLFSAGNKLQAPFRSQVKENGDSLNIESHPLELAHSWGGCGIQCATMIIIVSLVISGLVTLALYVVCRKSKSNLKSDDLPSASTPLNSSAHLLLGARTQDQQFHQTVFSETMLEFPRDRLILEETLGEGEFGKVMKGKAKHISRIPGTTTVAVKMLKDGSSTSEKRDLVSELNLLKEISHPNVIHLLGACTDESGPLYVIMEYAEHGSLITYLRKIKNEAVQPDIPELIGFALQIAKGMEYLSCMKVVHRDLAARNVLVSSGKILKISDFGLSRDVYEGDTYLKLSKSRVPLKWMAIESLENHLYTTKSDVWSYGILLWEIITIGGCPYPGIPSDHLFDLLKDGYRMPRPEKCPLPLYDIMRVCWLEKPNERPHFKELVLKIVSILNDLKFPPRVKDESCLHLIKKGRSKEDASMLQQLTTFPNLSVQQIGPYENQCLISPSEFSV